ncbi:hypothetical protein NEOLEDRAFT_1069434 [Neolentinus lepideus HHB14362 ss-1]|uniref:Ubiquitin-like domain-containing protein n=1 Tax=Neolentinus lepideus HHB14362 ss-1 TaxID=1314782 RepID=A0A165R781_9AGAM|nr:hypothetical protein NEOLEDRAFT_1069434 [Neolentinus lepideus HHB14362 ss-1]
MTRPLSDKAKGKRRAIDSEPQGGPSSVATSHDLTVRFTEGFQDLALQVKPGDTVRDVKKQARIRDARPLLQNRRLRLIHSGKLLMDRTDLHKLSSSLSERQNRNADNDGDEAQPLLTANWLHCSVGPELTEGEEDMEGSQAAQIRPLRGFDRLAAAGFSEEDIASIRRQFHNSGAHDYLDSDLGEESDYDERARILEEQWIDALDHTGDASLSDSSPAGSTIVLRGIVMGFFFPLLPFFFFREPKPAVFWENGQEHESLGSVIFSKRMQMGIVVGFLANFSFGLWRYLLTS